MTNAASWPSGRAWATSPFADSVRPAMIEFSFFGGIHRIDGRSTGVLPETLAPMGVGANTPPT